MTAELILPTYNERKNLRSLVTEILRIQPDIGLIVVDDNSPDSTGQLAEELAKRYPIKVTHRRNKQGLSPAIAAGIRASKAELIGVMDADLSHPPALIPEMIEILKRDADIAIGSRNVEGGGVESWSYWRQFVSGVGTLLAKPLTDIRDPMSGYFFVKKKVVQGMNLNSKGYKILLEILVKGKYKKAVEIPYMFRTRSVGQSKMGLKEYALYLLDLSRLYSYSLFRQK